MTYHSWIRSTHQDVFVIRYPRIADAFGFSSPLDMTTSTVAVKTICSFQEDLQV
jgi:hypothetical protein